MGVITCTSYKLAMEPMTKCPKGAGKQISLAKITKLAACIASFWHGEGIHKSENVEHQCYFHLCWTRTRDSNTATVVSQPAT